MIKAYNIIDLVKTFKLHIFAVIGILILETLSYFYFGPIGGKLMPVINLSTIIDYHIPWITLLYPYYLIFPFIWFILFPKLAYNIGGDKLFWKYISISFVFYSISTIIYLFIPTTCHPSDYMSGLPSTDLFYDIASNLSYSNLNIFGSCPSYHNFWAYLFVLLGLIKKSKLLIGLGLLLTLSTLVLHQHNIIDVICTYILAGWITFLFCVKRSQYGYWN